MSQGPHASALTASVQRFVIPPVSRIVFGLEYHLNQRTNIQKNQTVIIKTNIELNKQIRRQIGEIRSDATARQAS